MPAGWAVIINFVFIFTVKSQTKIKARYFFRKNYIVFTIFCYACSAAICVHKSSWVIVVMEIFICLVVGKLRSFNYNNYSSARKTQGHLEFSWLPTNIWWIGEYLMNSADFSSMNVVKDAFFNTYQLPGVKGQSTKHTGGTLLDAVSRESLRTFVFGQIYTKVCTSWTLLISLAFFVVGSVFCLCLSVYMYIWLREWLFPRMRGL